MSDTITTTLRAASVGYEVRVTAEGDDDEVETQLLAKLEPGDDTFDAIVESSCDAPGAGHGTFDFATDDLPYERSFFHDFFDDQAAPFDNLCTFTFTRNSESDPGDVIIRWHVEANLRWIPKNDRKLLLRVSVDVDQQ